MAYDRNQEVRRFYDEVYEEGHPSCYGLSNWELSARTAILSGILDKWFRRAEVKADDRVLEIGCGLGALSAVHPKWFGVEYSASALRRGGSLSVARFLAVNGDARRLPFKGGSMGFIYSFATLEHIPRVEEAFEEIDRLLQPGGCALLLPAWNCRTWTVKKLEIRPYKDLTVSERLAKFLIPVRNHLGYRALSSALPRGLRELRLALRRPLKLEYRQLDPDLSLNERWPHISDDDAFVSIDAHAAIAWFKSRSYSCISHVGLFGRIGAKGTEVVVRKPR